MRHAIIVMVASIAWFDETGLIAAIASKVVIIIAFLSQSLYSISTASCTEISAWKRKVVDNFLTVLSVEHIAVLS